MTEYPRAKLWDIRGYHPSDIPKFSNLTSTTVSPRLKFNLRRERFVVVNEEVKYLFVRNSYQKALKEKMLRGKL